MNYKTILILLVVISAVDSILINGRSSNWKKCYNADHSPDKTLQARVGFLRRERGNCRAIFSIKVLDQEDNVKQQVYHQQHRCEQAKTNNPYVVKHTSNQTDYHGKYEICVEMVENENAETLIELFMGEKLNPIIFEHSDSPIPLVQSQQLLDLEMTVQSIKRSLVKSRMHYQSSLQKGNSLDSKITQMMDTNQLSNILEIISLIFFGLCWVRMASRLKKTK